MIMEALVLHISTFDGSLNTTVTTEAFAIPACPVNSVLITIVDPILVVFVY